jgi:uncharacterized protein (TIGR02246 family)
MGWSVYRNILFSAVLLLLLVSMSSAQESSDSRASEVRAAVDEGNAQYIAAYAKADAAALAAVYDPEGTKLHANGGVTRGREAIAAEVGEALERVGPIAVTIETVSLWVVDDRAYETGKWTYTYTAPEKGEQAIGGRYVTVWRQQADGGWRIVADMSVPCGERDE